MPKTPSGGCERQRVELPRDKGHLPRLPRKWYRGRAFVHWTLGVEHRATGWLTPAFYTEWQLALLHAAGRLQFACPAYVLMPDHIHLVLLGLNPASDQRAAVEFIQKHVRSTLAPAEWQRQPYDHLLREEERERGAFESVAHYVLANPVRAGIAKIWDEYPYLGCCVPGDPEFNVRSGDYWPRFWRCYNYLSRDS